MRKQVNGRNVASYEDTHFQEKKKIFQKNNPEKFKPRPKTN